MAQNKDMSENIDFDSQNIFDEFSESEKIWDEVQKLEEEQKRDTYYYLKKLSSFLFTINTLIFIWICISVVYIYIQSGDQKKEYSFLAPICSLFLWNIDVANGSCYGVKPILDEYTQRLEEEKAKQVEAIVPLIGEVYSIENFNLSKKVLFLLEKTNTRVKPLEILSAFDEIKTKFTPRDKLEISCYDITLNTGNILELSCDVFSTDWDTQILSFEDGAVKDIEWWGTSVTKARSFISFIENIPESPFTILSAPEALSSEAANLSPYTQKTNIHLKLQYNSNKISY